MENTDAKKARRNVIIFSAIIIALILLLLIAVIVVAVNKTAKTSDAQIAEPVAENIVEKNDTTEVSDTTKTTEVAKAPEITTNVAPAADTSSSVPDTGPEDVLPFALIAGTTVAYLASRRLAKAEA